MSPFRIELTRQLCAWRADHGTPACPREVRESIARRLREEKGAPVTGLAALTPERRAEISSMGGQAAHRKGTAYAFTSEKAREAGRLGGKAAHKNGTAHEFTVEKAREASAKGAAARVARVPEKK